MGKLLVLMRHSKAHRPNAGQADRDRKLNEKGIHRANAVGRIMEERGYTCSMALVSSAARTRETFDIVKQHSGTTANGTLIKPNLYLTGLEDYFDEMKSIPAEVDSLLVVGHNPTITWLSAQLSGVKDLDMATGSAMVLMCDIYDWADLDARSCKVVEFIDVRKLG